ncbi:hypothetical protein [Aliamphritea ceti]|uniref:hypothetical protein n=1 Tax=Aliamphritea ceti TaxID=1524258 RepID=UPI0021C27619|nr:hypothetical protein [Aliamphritea ceti]
MRGYTQLFCIFTLACSLLLSGCATQNSGFKISQLAKTDIDSVTDAHITELKRLNRQLAIKLYKRNPRELAKVVGNTSIDSRVDLMFNRNNPQRLTELHGLDGINAVPLAFTEDYQGDRVYALMAGMISMLDASYNNKDEFFLLDELDQQKLYNSARNLETIAWRLNSLKQENEELFLLSNGVSPDGVKNLSFERIFGKMIALQDMMASLVAGSSNRTITKVVHSVASTTLLPI